MYVNERRDSDNNTVKTIYNPEKSIMHDCFNSDEIEIFETKNFQDLILFKWKQFARTLHLVGCLMHFFYIAVISSYVYAVYVLYDMSWSDILEKLLILSIIYPSVYDSI
jgi:hypothetical protein